MPFYNLPRAVIPSPAPFFQPATFRTLSEVLPGRTKIELSSDFFAALEDYIAWAENVPRKMRQAEDYLARFLSLLMLGHVQKESGGPRRDPSNKPHPLAWMTPVPRVTDRYYLGWRVQRIRKGTWILTNDSREAFYIEYGLHRNPRTGQPSPRRIRRPIMKRAFQKTAIQASSTAVGHRIFAEVFFPKPGQPGRRTKNLIWWIQGGHTPVVYTDFDVIPFGGGVGIHPFG